MQATTGEVMEAEALDVEVPGAIGSPTVDNNEDIMQVDRPEVPLPIQAPFSPARPGLPRDLNISRYPGSELSPGSQHQYAPIAVLRAQRRLAPYRNRPRSPPLSHSSPMVSTLERSDILSAADDDNAVPYSFCVPSSNLALAMSNNTNTAPPDISTSRTDVVVELGEVLRELSVGFESLNLVEDAISLPRSIPLKGSDSYSCGRRGFVLPSAEALISLFLSTYGMSSAVNVQQALNDDLQRNIPNFFFSSFSIPASQFTTIHLRPKRGNPTNISYLADENDGDSLESDCSDIDGDDDYIDRSDEEDTASEMDPQMEMDRPFDFSPALARLERQRSGLVDDQSASQDRRRILVLVDDMPKDKPAKTRPLANEANASRPTRVPVDQWVDSNLHPLINFMGDRGVMARPPISFQNRQTMAEFTSYHRNPQAGHYGLGYFNKGQFLGGYGSQEDQAGPGLWVIISHVRLV
ncbi:hypothetical protein P7C70_g3571, partial [Phenoliferia sp. Uapishka_3]